MAAFFGIDEINAQGFTDRCMLCLPKKSGGKLELHAVESPIRNQDIVFIKHCTSDYSLHIKAVGVVQLNYCTENCSGTCMPVKWVWQGERMPMNVDEAVPLSCEPLYEEHNVMVQREIFDLLPGVYHLEVERFWNSCKLDLGATVTLIAVAVSRN